MYAYDIMCLTCIGIQVLQRQLLQQLLEYGAVMDDHDHYHLGNEFDLSFRSLAVSSPGATASKMSDKVFDAHGAGHAKSNILASFLMHTMYRRLRC